MPTVITLHLPLTSATNRLIGAAELARMKRDAVLVNTSRGNMIVEADLAGALRRRRLRSRHRCLRLRAVRGRAARIEQLPVDDAHGIDGP